MDRDAWNERYRSAELVWGAEPNRFVAEELGAQEPAGRALDLACGEGRNAIWLAKRGWAVTAIDQSPVAIERARELARAEDVHVDWDPEALAGELRDAGLRVDRCAEVHRAVETEGSREDAIDLLAVAHA